MAKGNKDVDDLIKVGALIGGMWLALEILKAGSRKIYRCPVCNTEVTGLMLRCPTCKSPLKWF